MDSKKKMIRLDNFDYIDSLLKNRCQNTGESEKDVYGRAIMNELLPGNPMLRNYAELELYPKGEFDKAATVGSKSHVSNTSASICYGISGNVLELVKINGLVKKFFLLLMNLEFQKRTKIDKNVELRHHLLQQLNAFIKLLQTINDPNEAEKNKLPYKAIPDDTFRLLNDLKEALEKDTDESLEEINDSTWLAMLFKIVCENWDDVFIHCSQYTMDRVFRMLGDVCKMSNWNDDLDTRYKLLEIMKELDY